MAGTGDIGPAARRRIRAWLRYIRTEYYEKHGRNDADMAAEMGIAHPTLSNIISGKRTAGLDVVLKIRQTYKIPTDSVLFGDPPGWQEPGDAPPAAASPSGRPGKR
jgi:transcriptional regulator with XRE-family HTH domain